MLLVQLHPVARQPISPVSESCSNCSGDQRWGVVVVGVGVEGENKGGVRGGGRKCITAGQRAKDKTTGNYELQERRLQQTVSEGSPECHLLSGKIGNIRMHSAFLIVTHTHTHTKSLLSKLRVHDLHLQSTLLNMNDLLSA